MSLFDTLFGKKKNSAQTAKDRLTIMIAKERNSVQLPYLDDMKAELIEVIKKYTKVEDVKIKTQNSHNIDLLEVEIVLGK
jgi:cell division topological specificity factor